MSRLTKEMKDTFVSLLVAKSFDEDIKAADEVLKTSSLGDELYNAVVPEEIQQALLDMDFFDEIAKVGLRLPNDEHRVGTALMLPLSIPRVALGGSIDASNWNAFRLNRDKKSNEVKITGCIAKNDVNYEKKGKESSVQKLNKKLNCVAKKHQKNLNSYLNLIGEKRAFKTSLERSIGGLRTIKSLKGLSKEIADAWDQLMGEDGKEMKLPAIIPDSINQKLQEKMPFADAEKAA